MCDQRPVIEDHNDPLVPTKFREAAERYIYDRIKPGHFLTAVLENDLKEAVTRADEDTLKVIRNIVWYVYNCLPGKSWGSPEIVKAWLEKREA